MRLLFVGLIILSNTILSAQTVTVSSTASGNTIYQGTTVTFTANTTGFTNPTYQWYKNNVVIPLATLTTYQTNSLNNNDQIKVLVYEGALEGNLINTGLTLNLDAGNASSYPGTGNTWTDLIGTLTGTLYNFSSSSYSSDNKGVLEFDGSDDYVSLPSGVYFNGDFTIQSWIYPTLIQNWSRILDFGNGAGGHNVLLAESYGMSGFPGMYVEGAQYQANALLPTGQWSQLVATLSGTTATIYLNGTNIGYTNLNVSQNIIINNNYIGKSNLGGGDPNFKGKMSNLQIYNRALSNSEITTNYNSLYPRFTSYSSNIITTTVLVPTIAISSPLAQLTSNCSGVPSSPTTFGVTGSNLTSGVTVSAPTGFEVSTSSNTSYSSSLSLTPSGSNTVSSTLYIRLVAGATIGISGTISVASSGAVSQTTTVSSTNTTPPPVFAVAGPYTICSEGTYSISLTVTNSYNGWSSSASNVASVNSSGFVTAISPTGSANITFTDACGNSVTQSINIVSPNSNSVSAVSDGQASYKINNTNTIPQGPTASLYVGYNGVTYSSITKPTNTGYYKANNQSGNSAGCPYPFYIFRCTTCPD